jgi:hypothetical protein
MDAPPGPLGAPAAVLFTPPLLCGGCGVVEGVGGGGAGTARTGVAAMLFTAAAAGGAAPAEVRRA